MKIEKAIKKFKYKDGVAIKYDNRKIIICELPNGNFGLNIISLCKKEEMENIPPLFTIFKGKVKTLRFSLTKEAMGVLHMAIQHMLTKSPTTPLTPQQH